MAASYVSNGKAWMTNYLFEDWIMKLHKKFSIGKKVLLIIENWAAHLQEVKFKIKSF